MVRIIVAFSSVLASILVGCTLANATMPRLTPKPTNPSPGACKAWAENQDDDAMEMWGIQEDGSNSRAAAIDRLARSCMGQHLPEIVGFGSSAGFNQSYCRKHPTVKVCRELTSSRSYSEVSTGISSRLAGNKATFWRAVMTRFYGPYDQHQRCWMGRVYDENGSALYCMRPHRLDITESTSGELYYLAMGGSRISAGGIVEDCFACAGRLGLVILRIKGDAFYIVGQNSLHEPFGSRGNVPDEDAFSVQRLGPNDAYGWVIKSGESHGGTAYEHYTLYGIVRNRLLKLGTFPKHYDDLGNCDADKNNTKVLCSNYEYTLDLDTLSSASSFFPIILRAYGTRRGVPLNDVFTAQFDSSKEAYVLPPALPDD